MDEPYYRPALARIHHLGFGFHADRCAPGILSLLQPVRAGDGLVVELGCGTGLLTRHLVDAGHRVLATDASPAMLDLTRQYVPDVEARLLRLPDDPIPPCAAVVSVGHVLSYLPTEADIDRALVAIARALEPGGILAIDLCDLRWGEARRDAPPIVRVEEDWALFTRFSMPSPDRFVRDMTMFVRDGDAWQRDDEHHDNVLIDTMRVPTLLAAHDVDARVTPSFGDETLPDGLVAVTGARR